MRKQGITILFAAILAVIIAAALSYARDDKEEVAGLLAETYLASGQNEKAIEVYRKLIEKDPADIKACCQKHGRFIGKIHGPCL